MDSAEALKAIRLELESKYSVFNDDCRDIIGDAELVAILKQLVSMLGTQRQAAEALGVSAQYFTDVLHHKRTPGAAILAPLGLKRLVIYTEE